MTHELIPDNNPLNQPKDAPSLPDELRAPSSTSEFFDINSQPTDVETAQTGLLYTPLRKVAAGALGIALLGGIGGAGYAVGHSKEPKRTTNATAPANLAESPSPTDATIPAISPTDLPSTIVATPTEAATPESTGAQNPEIKAKKGSVEYYQVYVENDPDPTKAIEDMGKLENLFITSGKPDPQTSTEAVSSVHADDNILVAMLGEELAQDASGVAGWRHMREVIAGDRAILAEYTNNTITSDYELTYTPLDSEPQIVNGKVTVRTSITASAPVNATYSLGSRDESSTADITLEQIPNKNGDLVWQITAIQITES